MKKQLRSNRSSVFILAVMALLIIPAVISAQPIFSFAVNDLEAYDRTGNWVYDADGPTFPSNDGNWFTYAPGAYPFHYYAEKYIHNGVTTSLTCIGENTALANDPSEISITFTQFDLVAFNRVNTVNPALPWNTPGQSGDERVYTNASGYISYNGIPKLYMNNATFVITTPYPNQNQIKALNPIFAPWTGNIGTGAPQTGYGFGWIDTVTSDPAWAALFAAADYKVDLGMVGITSQVFPTYGLFDFTLTVSPGAVPQTTINTPVNLSNLPQDLTFPAQDAAVNVTGGTGGGPTANMQTIYLNRIGTAPGGTLPPGLQFPASRYWELGSTLSSFLLSIRFTVDNADFAKAPVDWRILYRAGSWDTWQIWNDYTLLNSTTIRANNVSQVGEFAIASPIDETLPVELASFAAYVNSDNLAEIKWMTGSETSMVGFRVYANQSEDFSTATCLTPVIIPAENCSCGASYSYTAESINAPGTYYFWLQAISMADENDFFGPISLVIEENGNSPALPERDLLGNAYPNPFVSSTRIDFDIKAGERGTLAIYNLAGQLISSRTYDAGSHSLNWNGLDSNGRKCANGIYLYKLSTPTYSAVKRLVIVN